MELQTSYFFVALVEEHIEKLKSFPLLGKSSEYTDDYYLVISKQTTLIYNFSGNNTIELLLFWNNKWNPNDLESFLN